MELLLIRHARPNRAGGGAGPADPSLSPLGRRQADALASWLAGEPIDAVYTSHLRRAVETAEPLAAKLGLRPVVDESVAEYDADAPDYIPVEELRAVGDPRWKEPPADLPEFARRVVDGIERISSAHSGERVAVVCHGGVVNVYMSWVLGLGPAMFFLPAYTSVSRVLASSTGNRSLATLNETGHLRLADVPLTELPGR